jgi:uncharacterized repeat protein (TIGR03803 family)
MKRVVKVLVKPNFSKLGYAILVLLATTAVALAGQTSVWAVSFKTIHSFDNTDGAYPEAAVIQATNGNLYGTTAYGGANPGLDGFGGGTVFKINPYSGKLTTLYSFCSEGAYPYCTEGAYPTGGLVQITKGDLCGTTAEGGADISGTVSCINPYNVKLTTLHSFDGTHRGLPNAGLIQATDGNLCGTTQLSGADEWGIVFCLDLHVVLTTLHSFNLTNGAEPDAGLLQAANGKLRDGQRRWGQWLRHDLRNYPVAV